MDLFAHGPQLPEDAPPPPDAPLAERMRPRSLDEFIGQERLSGLLEGVRRTGRLPSLILWGPPGCGKTTLARLLVRAAGLAFVPFSAVTGGVKQVREVVRQAEDRRKLEGQRSVLFVDEIHRFNKAQQDAFLPHVERGAIVLLGATTENPSFELNAALLSRAQVVVLEALSPVDIRKLLERAVADPERGLGGAVDVEADALDALASASQGDARFALNLLEVAADLARAEGSLRVDPALLERAQAALPLRHDKSGEAHYDVVSAFIKSLRGSDPDAAIYYLARLVEGGEDPRFLARRMVVFASEDVGNADPAALEVAVNVARAVDLVGLPEARINLAQGAAYLALAPKSNASYLAIDEALAAVRERGALPVPLHLRNAPTRLLKSLGYGQGYAYPHDAPEGVTSQRHLPSELEGVRFYRPSPRGLERELARRLDALRRRREG